MSNDLQSRVDAYIQDHLDEWIAELSTLCAQPSVSAQGLGIRECAALVADMLRRRGFSAEIMPTAGHPVVYAEARGQSSKTLMFYNHYDVQPPEPLDLWESPPFEPTLRGRALYARGVSDDKGHIVCRLAAIDAIKAVTGELPCNIKFLIEGEEEISSVSLPPFIKANREKFAADACIWEFGGVNEAGIPMQDAGMRGICYVELRAKTATLDAHSGLGGSIFPNAAWRLVWALNTLKDPDEHIRIPGFYDDVVPPTRRDLELLDALPDESQNYLKRYGVKGFLKGLTGGLDLKREGVFVPTCTICGLTSGYQGPGSKTVLPAEASAKVDFRLVPNQTPEEIVAKLRKHLDAQGFGDVEVVFIGGEAPGRVDPDHPFVKLVVEAAKGIYEHDMMISPMIGGSGPNHAFIEYLNVPIATAGVGYPGSRAHAPNENMRLDLFLNGTRHTARIIQMFAESG
ncbi:MAG TPA: M20/M25/M40 family metallo-hydrolase [Anaerolineae bacterium]|nr:M20/M25/M40 family metallo-hydrolase [Anaerolineae bacterium]